MLIVLLPLFLSLLFALGVLVDPLRTLGGAHIGSKDLSVARTMRDGLMWSFASLAIYLALFGWTYWSVTEFLLRTFLLGPGLTLAVALSINWMRRESRQLVGA